MKIFFDVIKLQSKYHNWMIFKNFELDKVMRIEEIFKILPFYEFLAIWRMKTIELKILPNIINICFENFALDKVMRIEEIWKFSHFMKS